MPRPTASSVATPSQTTQEVNYDTAAAGEEEVVLRSGYVCGIRTDSGFASGVGASEQPTPLSDLQRPLATVEGHTGAMSDTTGGPTSLVKELTCPICLEYYVLPVTVVCGHTFCRHCIGLLKTGSCPLCRSRVGGTLAINTVLQNLITNLGLRRNLTKPTPSASYLPPASPVDEQWWKQNVTKKRYASVTVMLSALLDKFTPRTARSQIWFFDLVACAVERLTNNHSAKKAKWICSFEDCVSFCSLLNLDPLAPEKNLEEMHALIEEFLSLHPDVARKCDNVRLIFKVNQDRTHKIESQTFDSINFQPSLPWECGRAPTSALRILHTSVSMNHLIIVPYHQDESSSSGNASSTTSSLTATSGVGSAADALHSSDGSEVSSGVGVIDCGSTIGTMIKLDSDYVLRQGDIVHLGDKVEFVVQIQTSPRSRGVSAARSSTKRGSPRRSLISEPDSVPLEARTTNTAQAASENSFNHIRQGRSGTLVGLPKSARAAAYRRNRAATRSDDLSSSNSHKKSLQSEECPILKLVLNSGNCGSPEEAFTVSPAGVVLGRGPSTIGSYEKLCVTDSNGYVSRIHCSIHYETDRTLGRRWILKDRSAYGTYLRLKEFDKPWPLRCGTTLKIGQCKVQVSASESESPPRPYAVPRIPTYDVSSLNGSPNDGEVPSTMNDRRVTEEDNPPIFSPTVLSSLLFGDSRRFQSLSSNGLRSGVSHHPRGRFNTELVPAQDEQPVSRTPEDDSSAGADLEALHWGADALAVEEPSSEASSASSDNTVNRQVLDRNVEEGSRDLAFCDCAVGAVSIPRRLSSEKRAVRNHGSFISPTKRVGPSPLTCRVQAGRMGSLHDLTARSVTNRKMRGDRTPKTEPNLRACFHKAGSSPPMLMDSSPNHAILNFPSGIYPSTISYWDECLIDPNGPSPPRSSMRRNQTEIDHADERSNGSRRAFQWES